ncbi:MAG: dethiobiotin synthase [Kiritimatiellae bacterium]|nr:dethiobiotin synthase [Kiritimatiellia bacterium]
MQSLFITGTDTGVGKTVLAASLYALCRAQGINAIPMKPVQTGCVKKAGKWIAPDIEFCLSMSMFKPLGEEMKHIAPYQFEPACSPHLAAQKDSAAIDIEYIVKCFQTLTARYDTVLVEGAGGVLVPLSENKTMLDLMIALKLPVLLAARPGLGTLNHTLLSIKALRHYNVFIKGVVFIETGPVAHGFIEEENIRMIEKLGQIPVYGPLPYMENLASGTIEACHVTALFDVL